MSQGREFSPELALSNAVREWAGALVPGDEATIRAGVSASLYAYAHGASMAEAVGYAKRCVGSRLRHPSYSHAGAAALAAAS